MATQRKPQDQASAWPSIGSCLHDTGVSSPLQVVELRLHKLNGWSFFLSSQNMRKEERERDRERIMWMDRTHFEFDSITCPSDHVDSPLCLFSSPGHGLPAFLSEFKNLEVLYARVNAKKIDQFLGFYSLTLSFSTSHSPSSLTFTA